MPDARSSRILLVDDDAQALESTRKILELAGHAVVTAGDGEAALDAVRAPGAAFDLVVSDVRMPRMGGLEFLKALSLCAGHVPVVLMTAFGRVEDAVWALKLGAVDFLSKPIKRQALVAAVQAALERARPGAARAGQASGSSAAQELLGSSAAIARLRDEIARAAPTAATVLVQGESGTGKELVARAIHRRSPRAGAPFIALNCAAMPDNLIESELFGFEKGAFTGAAAAKPGLFEAADGGTLLLDEIGDMPPHLQTTLLRTLQEGEVRRIGATASRRVDVRVIAATHRDLRAEVAAGRFRQDLLFRLEVIGLRVPPLRERSEDVPGLADAFLARFAAAHGSSARGFTREAMDALLAHSWPGNVRELSNVVERAAVFCRQGEVGAEHLPAHLLARAPRQDSAGTIAVRVGTPLHEVEELLIRKTLEATDGDKNTAAKLLGINSRTIYRKLETKKDPPESGESL